MAYGTEGPVLEYSTCSFQARSPWAHAGGRRHVGERKNIPEISCFYPQFLGVSYLGRAYELALRWKTIRIPSEASEKQYRYFFLQTLFLRLLPTDATLHVPVCGFLMGTGVSSITGTVLLSS